MSYLTQKCPTCNGTSRIHITTSLECSHEKDCDGCIRCRECIEGRTAGVGGSGAGKNLVRLSTREGTPRDSTTSGGARFSSVGQRDGSQGRREGSDNMADGGDSTVGSKRPSVVTTIKQAFKRSSTVNRSPTISDDNKTPTSASETVTSGDSPVFVSASDALPPTVNRTEDEKALPSLPNKDVAAIAASPGREGTVSSTKGEDTSSLHSRSHTPTSDKGLAGTLLNRKTKKAASPTDSVLSPMPPSVPSVSLDGGLLSYSHIVIAKGKGFREWYTQFVAYGSHKSAAGTRANAFSFPITLQDIYNTKKATDEVEPFYYTIKNSSLYDKLCKEDPEGFGEHYPVFVGRAEKDLLKTRFAKRFRPLDIFVEDKAPSKCVITVGKDGIERITSGPIEALIDALIFPLNEDMSYANVFLACYRFFLEPVALFQSLVEWYNVDLNPSTPGTAQDIAFLKRNKRPIQSRVMKVLLLWIKNHWQDFQINGLLINSVISFAEFTNEVNFGDGQRLDQAIREQRLSWYTLQYMPAYPPRRKTGGERTGDEFNANFLSTESDDTSTIAKELSLIDVFFARQIKPATYIDILARPVKLKYGSRNAGLRVLMEQLKWNRMLNMYISIVFIKESPKNKSKVLKRVIKIAQTLYELQSFNLVFCFINALESPTISRCAAAWENLNIKYVEIFRKLQDFVNSTKGHQNYWSIVAKIQTPIVPYLAPYIHDILINFENGYKESPELFKFVVDETKKDKLQLKEDEELKDLNVTSAISKMETKFAKKSSDEEKKEEEDEEDSFPALKRNAMTRKRTYMVRKVEEDEDDLNDENDEDKMSLLDENMRKSIASRNSAVAKGSTAMGPKKGAKAAEEEDELSAEDKEYLQLEVTDYVPTFEVNFQIFESIYSVAAELEYWLRGPTDFLEVGQMKDFKTDKERLPELFTHIRDVCVTNSTSVSEEYEPYV